MSARQNRIITVKPSDQRIMEGNIRKKTSAIKYKNEFDKQKHKMKMLAVNVQNKFKSQLTTKTQNLRRERNSSIKRGLSMLHGLHGTQVV